ncbi:DUF4337 domain-containing protein [Sphingomonas sp.]|uniref:DUF4337 domain-containing protein n=1 Tax=Sphingomonas sp. TaxID=28214 RepID=UPI003CC5FEE5
MTRNSLVKRAEPPMIRAMDVEVTAEAKDKRLNRLVAITVVFLSVFMGLGNIKDGNIVQAMAQAQSNSVDRWNEYQASRTKRHIVDTAAQQLAATAGRAPSPAITAALAAMRAESAHYVAEAPGLAHEAKGFAAQYDALNIHDDQFDASEALISTAISLAAVAALVESAGVLWLAWAFGAFGVFMGVCGFAGWGFHPDVLSNFLG